MYMGIFRKFIESSIRLYHIGIGVNLIECIGMFRNGKHLLEFLLDYTGIWVNLKECMEIFMNLLESVGIYRNWVNLMKFLEIFRDLDEFSCIIQISEIWWNLLNYTGIGMEYVGIYRIGVNFLECFFLIFIGIWKNLSEWWSVWNHSTCPRTTSNH